MARYTVENIGGDIVPIWEVRLEKKGGGYKILRVTGSSWNIERAVANELRNNAGAYLTSHRGGARVGAGRYSNAYRAAINANINVSRIAEANRAQLHKINSAFWNLINVGAGAAAVANARMSEEIAEKMLRHVYNARGKYNIYSGNLDNAYQATIVQGRRIVKVIKLSKVKGNGFYVNENGRKNRKIVDLLEERHPIGRIRKKSGRTYGRVRYRYKKRWEREKGYDNTGIGAGRNRISGFGYAAGKDNRVQSGIIIENMAPYAGAVQARGYDVLPAGIERSFAGRAAVKQKQLIMNIANNLLKAARLT